MIENMCLSGGADGADLQWGMNAGRAGHQVIHWSFARHKTQAPDAEVVILTDAQLREADPHLDVAKITLKRTYPAKSPYVNNLLRRNYFQVRDTGAVYAVSSIDRYGLVEGGTAWAVQMFLDRFDGIGALACYVFDQIVGTWFQWIDGSWSVIDGPPRPSGIWTGIGTRDLNPVGKEAIRALFRESEA